jgi:hypothetical protein
MRKARVLTVLLSRWCKEPVTTPIVACICKPQKKVRRTTQPHHLFTFFRQHHESRSTGSWNPFRPEHQHIFRDLDRIMADPFTIMGTTSAVISFVQLAGNIIGTAHNLYASTTGMSTENEELEVTISKLNQLMDILTSENAADFLSNQEKSIAELGATCGRLGEKLVRLLQKTKAKKAQSVRASLQAAMATIWTKSVIIELRRELGYCTMQLSLYLQMIMSYFVPMPGAGSKNLIFR